jgi:uncharacterized protein YggU (UPF0235/DUF167 family)
MIDLTPHNEGTILLVIALPGAKRNAILGERAGALRVAVTAAPERGKANDAVRKLLAVSLGCRPSQIALLSGESSRQKRFLVAGVGGEDLGARLAGILSAAAPPSPST